MECDPINLLVLAKNESHQDEFMEDLEGFLESEDYQPDNDVTRHVGITTFKVLSREFRLISGPVLLESDSPTEVTAKIFKVQDHFILPVNLNGIIFVIPPHPLHYEHVLFLNFFNNFSKDDISKMEKNVIFVFVHNDQMSFQKRDMVDADLWTVLERIGDGLLHSKTFHYHSRMDKDFCKMFVHFIYKNKKTLLVETVYSHNSVLKVVGNDDFLEILLEALFVNEDNILNYSTDKKGYFCLFVTNCYITVCTNQICITQMCSQCIHQPQICCQCSQVKTKSLLRQCTALINKSTCAKCNCSVNLHKLVKFRKLWYEDDIICPSVEEQKKHRHTLISMIVTIDLFNKNCNTSVGQLYHRLTERIKQEPRYSKLETVYEYEMSGREKGITADDCIKYILKSLPTINYLIKIQVDFKDSTLLAGGNLRVKC